jgi:hypothetical protein
MRFFFLSSGLRLIHFFFFFDALRGAGTISFFSSRFFIFFGFPPPCQSALIRTRGGAHPLILTPLPPRAWGKYRTEPSRPLAATDELLDPNRRLSLLVHLHTRRREKQKVIPLRLLALAALWSARRRPFPSRSSSRARVRTRAPWGGTRAWARGPSKAVRAAAT